MNVKITLFNEDLEEEICMEQLDGFMVPGKEKKYENLLSQFMD